MSKVLVKYPMVDDHSVSILPEDRIKSLLHIPLKLQGLTSYFPARAVPLSEYKSDDVPYLHLTVKAPD